MGEIQIILIIRGGYVFFGFAFEVFGNLVYGPYCENNQELSLIEIREQISTQAIAWMGKWGGVEIFERMGMMVR